MVLRVRKRELYSSPETLLETIIKFLKDKGVFLEMYSSSKAALKKTMVPKIDAARKRITSSQTLVPKNET